MPSVRCGGSVKSDAKLYIVVRTDMPFGDQLAQAVHAALRFAQLQAGIYVEWSAVSNTVAILAAADIVELRAVRDRCIDHSFRCVEFYEPDMGYAMTALAIEPAGTKAVRGLSLAGVAL